MLAPTPIVMVLVVDSSPSLLASRLLLVAYGESRESNRSASM